MPNFSFVILLHTNVNITINLLVENDHNVNATSKATRLACGINDNINNVFTSNAQGTSINRASYRNMNSGIIVV